MTELKVKEVNGRTTSPEEISAMIEDLQEDEMLQIKYKGEDDETK